ncbi:MAG: hypothetical protein LQ347_002760 [Umbilicaria vellea]|nr:MAG: hypothetical protein LQ347_002760 [Umbilicaria vellea]
MIARSSFLGGSQMRKLRSVPYVEPFSASGTENITAESVEELCARTAHLIGSLYHGKDLVPPRLGLRGEDSPRSQDFHLDPALGGGQEVRLCNPCVPDPNPAPPPAYPLPGQQGLRSFPRPDGFAVRPLPVPPLPGARAFSSHTQSAVIPVAARSSGQLGDTYQPEDLLPRDSNAAQQPTDESLVPDRYENLEEFLQRQRGNGFTNHASGGTPPPRHRHHVSTSSVPSHPRYRSMLDSSTLLPQRALPQPQLREEDECPVCHCALPPKGADGSETAREVHIASCIDSHFSSSTPRSSHPPPAHLATAAVIPPGTATPSQAGATSSAAGPEAAGSGLTSAVTPRRRAGGMLVYHASEKDCVGEDGEGAQECVICFEEFAVGDEMGRLECLCKFHRGTDKTTRVWVITSLLQITSQGPSLSTPSFAVMSLHRVGSISSYEQVRGASPARSEHRKMSFNPVGSWVPPAAQEEPVGAFVVSKSKRIPLKPVLVKEGVYKDRCTVEELGRGEVACYEQELRLNIMFTVAAVATNVIALPVGTVLDRYGPRVSGVTGSMLLAIGALLFAFASHLPFDGYIPGYLFLALGGPFVFISSFQLSNTFPTHSGFILALLTGAFDSASALFLIFRLIYTASNGTFTTHKFFLIYLVVPVFILLAQLSVMPSRSYKTVGELVVEAENPSNDVEPGDVDISDTERLSRVREERRLRRESVVSEITTLLGKGADKQQKKEEKKKQQSGVWGALHGQSALQQIKTPWFWLITLFTVVQMTRINYFVATIRPQYEHLLSNYDLAEHVNHVFDVALPLGGVISIPFVGLILDHTSTPFVLGLLVAIATIVGVLGVLPYLWAAYINIALFVVYRPLYYTAVSDYTAKVFGFHTFGKVYGLIICLAGMFNFSQSALDALTHKVCGGDPVPVNVILLSAAFVVGSVLVGFVGYQSRHMARKRLEVEAEEATEATIPAAAGGAS